MHGSFVPSSQRDAAYNPAGDLNSGSLQIPQLPWTPHEKFTYHLEIVVCSRICRALKASNGQNRESGIQSH